MKIYKFRPKNFPVITLRIADYIYKEIKRGKKEIQVTLDLGRSISKLRVEGDSLFNNGQRCDIEDIRSIYLGVDDTELYAWINDFFFVLKFYSDKYYKLRNVKDLAPTLEINGIHMHRIKGISPWDDANFKVNALNITRKDKVLDICTGLGYTAIHAYYRSPAKLVTIEKDISVLRAAEFNPWSRDLEKINIVLGDAREVLEELEKGYFNKVIHDPPTYSISEELYSLDFYKKLYDILPRSALLYHYVGYPYEVRGIRRIRGNVLSRLKQVGFEFLREVNYGFLLRK